MAKKWSVYRSDGSLLGSFSAAEIRQGLRDGRLDPFDQVARSGSSERNALVEVDEIFASETTPATKPPEKTRALTPPEPVYDNDGGDDGPQVGTAIAASVPTSDGNLAVSKPFNFSSLAKPFILQRKRKAQTTKKRLRRYFAVDKNKRLLGPLSAAEIQSLFNRGILDKSVKVTRENNNQKVPIAQFLTAYAGERGRKKPERAQSEYAMISGGYPSTKVMDQMTRTVQTNTQARDAFVPILSIAAMGLLIAMSYFLVKQIISSNNKAPQAQEEQTPKKQESHHEEELPPMQISPRRAPPKEISQPATRSVEREVVKPKKKPKRSKPPPPPPRVEEAEPLPRPRAVNRNQPLYRPPPKAAAAPRPVTRPAPVRAQPPPQNALGSKVGQVASLRVTFSPQAVSACGLKCTLALRDSSGARLQAVFFKGAFEAQLMKAGGSATVTGRIDKKGNDYVIYLQGVR